MSDTPEPPISSIRRLRIQHDGAGPASMARVTDADTGALLEGVTYVGLTLDANDRRPVTAFVEVYNPVIDITAEAHILHVCPYCKQQVEQIETVDEEAAHG